MTGFGSVFPANLDSAYVRGQFIDLGGAAMRGTITFAPNFSPVLLDPDPQLIIGKKSFTATLDQQGKFALALPVTDDPDVNPSGWTYTVTEPGTGRSYDIAVPISTPVLNSPGDPLHGFRVINLITVVPSPTSGGTVQLVGTAPDATTTVKGKAVLLGGTADNPTVPWGKLTGVPDLATQAELDTAIQNVPTGIAGLTWRTVAQHGGVADCAQPSATLSLTSGSTTATLSATVAGLKAGQTVVTDTLGRYLVSAVSGTSVTLAAPAAGTAAGQKFIYGTDNTAAFNALFAACLTTPQVAVIPNGRFLICGTIGVLEPGPNAQQVSTGLTVFCGGAGGGNTMRLSYQPATMFAGSALVWGGNPGGTMVQFSRMVFTNFIGGLAFVGQSTYDSGGNVVSFGPRPAIGFHLSQDSTPWAGTGYLTAGDWSFSDMDEGIRFGSAVADNNCDTSLVNRLYFERVSVAGVRIRHEQGLSYRFNWIHAAFCYGSVVKCEGGGAVEIGSVHLSYCGTATADPTADNYALDLASGYSGYVFTVALLRPESGTVRVAAVRDGWTHLNIGVFEEANSPSTDSTLFLVAGGTLQINGGHLASAFASNQTPFYLTLDSQSKQPRVALRELAMPSPDQWASLFRINPSTTADISVYGARLAAGYGTVPDRHSRLERGPVVVGGATTDAATATRLDPMDRLATADYVYSLGPRVPQGTSVVDMTLVGDRGTNAPSVFRRRWTLYRSSGGVCTLVSTETVGTDLVQGTDQLLALTFDTYSIAVVRVQGTAGVTINWRARLEMRSSYVAPSVVDY